MEAGAGGPTGRPLELYWTVREDDIMWVFDGEEWIEEGGSRDSAKNEKAMRIPISEFVPELQVLEIVPTPKSNPIPPFPLP